MELYFEVLQEVESVLDFCKDKREYYMLEALDNFRSNSRDFACFCDGNLNAYERVIGLLDNILDLYDQAGAGATS